MYNAASQWQDYDLHLWNVIKIFGVSELYQTKVKVSKDSSDFYKICILTVFSYVWMPVLCLYVHQSLLICNFQNVYLYEVTDGNSMWNYNWLSSWYWCLIISDRGCQLFIVMLLLLWPGFSLPMNEALLRWGIVPVFELVVPTLLSAFTMVSADGPGQLVALVGVTLVDAWYILILDLFHTIWIFDIRKK